MYLLRYAAEYGLARAALRGFPLYLLWPFLISRYKKTHCLIALRWQRNPVRLKSFRFPVAHKLYSQHFTSYVHQAAAVDLPPSVHPLSTFHSSYHLAHTQKTGGGKMKTLFSVTNLPLPTHTSARTEATWHSIPGARVSVWTLLQETSTGTGNQIYVAFLAGCFLWVSGFSLPPTIAPWGAMLFCCCCPTEKQDGARIMGKCARCWLWTIAKTGGEEMDDEQKGD